MTPAKQTSASELAEWERAAKACLDVTPPEWIAEMDRYVLVGKPVGSCLINEHQTLALCATGEWAPKLVHHLACSSPAAVLSLIAGLIVAEIERLDRALQDGGA